MLRHGTERTLAGKVAVPALVCLLLLCATAAPLATFRRAAQPSAGQRRAPVFSPAAAPATMSAANLWPALATLRRAPTPKTDLGVYPEPPAPPLPRAGGKLIDATFGTEVMRVTDEATGTSAGTAYSYWPTLNCDSTKLLVQVDGSPSGYIYDFDPDTFTLGNHYEIQTLAGGRVLRGEDASWSASDARVLYMHTDWGTQVWAFDVGQRRARLVFDLKARLPQGASLFQMSKSADDDVFAASLFDAAYKIMGYVVYRRSTDALVRVVTPDVNEVRLDKTGQYLVVTTLQEGRGRIQSRIMDWARETYIDLTDDAPDYAPGHLDVGRATVVGHDNWRNGLTYRRLSAPHDEKLLFSFGNDWQVAMHVSQLADDEGWVLLSIYGAGGPGVLHDELVLLATDGSRRVWRLAHHHSVLRDYYDSPRANISRDGRFVAFTSNWGGRKRRDLFIARVMPPPPPTTRARPRTVTRAAHP